MSTVSTANDQNKRPLVSVIIPSYNRADRITVSAKSVLAQTFEDFELIIVDDGSSDNTDAVAAKLEENDSRVRYIKLPCNQGACAARNRGIDEAAGEYIAFHDSDDEWLPEKLEKQLQYIRETGCDMVYCSMKSVNGTKVRYIPEGQKNGDEPSLELILGGNKISTQTMFMKREVAENVRFDTSFRRLQDWDFALRVISAGYRVKYLDEPLVLYRMQDDSISKSVASEKAYLHLLEKHSAEYDMYPKAKARIYYVIAYRYKGVDKNTVKKYLTLSYALDKNPKTLLRKVMNSLGLWR